MAGRINEASESALAALEAARAYKQHGAEAHALWILGSAALHDDMAKARGYLSDALVLSEQLGMRPLAAHCHIALAKLNRLAGMQRQADEHLRTGVRMYREMRMAYWLREAEENASP
jgi:hypothetical protein